MCLSFSITVKKRFRVTFSFAIPFAIVQALKISYPFRENYFGVQFSPNKFLPGDSNRTHGQIIVQSMKFYTGPR